MSVHLDFAPRLMPAPAAAHYLGVSESTLYKLSIPRRIIGAKRLYDRLALDAYVSELPTEGEEAQNTCDGLFGASG